MLVIIIYSTYTERDYLYIFFKDTLKYLEYIYYNIYYNNNFSEIDF